MKNNPVRENLCAITDYVFFSRTADRDLESQRREKVNAWICTRQATDHDVQSQRHEKMNAWICARPTTHHDHVSVIPNEKR